MPAGVAEIGLEVTEEAAAGCSSGGTRSRVVMTERPLRGPAAWLSNPGLDALVHLRNARSLRRLQRLVEASAGEGAAREH